METKSLGFQNPLTFPGAMARAKRQLEKAFSFSLMMPDTFVFVFSVKSRVNVHCDDAHCDDAWDV